MSFFNLAWARPANWLTDSFEWLQRERGAGERERPTTLRERDFNEGRGEHFLLPWGEDRGLSVASAPVHVGNNLDLFFFQKVADWLIEHLSQCHSYRIRCEICAWFFFPTFFQPLLVCLSTPGISAIFADNKATFFPSPPLFSSLLFSYLRRPSLCGSLGEMKEEEEGGEGTF